MSRRGINKPIAPFRRVREDFDYSAAITDALCTQIMTHDSTRKGGPSATAKVMCERARSFTTEMNHVISDYATLINYEFSYLYGPIFFAWSVNRDFWYHQTVCGNDMKYVPQYTVIDVETGEETTFLKTDEVMPGNRWRNRQCIDKIRSYLGGPSTSCRFSYKSATGVEQHVGVSCCYEAEPRCVYRAVCTTVDGNMGNEWLGMLTEAQENAQVYYYDPDHGHRARMSRRLQVIVDRENPKNQIQKVCLRNMPIVMRVRYELIKMTAGILLNCYGLNIRTPEAFYTRDEHDEPSTSQYVLRWLALMASGDDELRRNATAKQKELYDHMMKTMTTLVTAWATYSHYVWFDDGIVTAYMYESGVPVDQMMRGTLGRLPTVADVFGVLPSLLEACRPICGTF